MGLSKYAISNYGVLCNLETGYQSIGSKDGFGYRICFAVHDNGIKSFHGAHALVAKAFLGIPEDDSLTVDHIDRQRSNNVLWNLRWATKEEQTLNRILPENRRGKSITQMTLDGFEMITWFSISAAAESMGVHCSAISRAIERNGTSCGYHWKFDYGYLNGEMWKGLPMDTVETCYVSNMGRIANSKIIVSYGSTTESGYKTISLATQKGKFKAFPVHRLIMLAFIGDDPRLVNHKDGNKKNNKLENLEYVTSSENAEHAIRIGLRVYKHNGPLSKPVKQMDRSLKIIAIYPSIGEASRKTGINKNSIGVLCRTHNLTQCAGGPFLWAYASSTDVIETSVKVSTNLSKLEVRGGFPKPVRQLDRSGNLITQYASIMDANRATGIEDANISRVCKGERKTAGGFKWEYVSM